MDSHFPVDVNEAASTPLPRGMAVLGRERGEDRKGVTPTREPVEGTWAGLDLHVTSPDSYRLPGSPSPPKLLLADHPQDAT